MAALELGVMRSKLAPLRPRNVGPSAPRQGMPGLRSGMLAGRRADGDGLQRGHRRMGMVGLGTARRGAVGVGMGLRLSLAHLVR